MERKKDKERRQEENGLKKSPKPLVTLLPPAQEERGEEWLLELEREAAALIQRRLQ